MCNFLFVGYPASEARMKTIEQLQEDLENAYGGQNTGDIEAALIAIEEHRRVVLVEGLLAVEALMNESQGVFGLHLNGDLSPWDELRTVGRFESWLSKFDQALAIAQSDHVSRNCV